MPEGAIRLTDWGVIRARGADAASLLHSLLTQDITHLDTHQARLAGLCSPKGRLLASFVVWRGAPDEILMACSADLLAPTLKRLSMFVLRAKCKLSDASAEIALHGLAGDAAQAWLADAAPTAAWSVKPRDDGWVVRLPDAWGQRRFLHAAPATSPAPELPAMDLAAWAWMEVGSGVVRICAATAEQFVPQMVNLELVGGVNFQKGCYPGQEVVARSQYRGTTKRRALLFGCEALLAPGQEVYSSQDAEQPAGMVANAAPRPEGGSIALVEVKLAALESGSLHLASATGPLLSALPLPYAMPAEEAA